VALAVAVFLRLAVIEPFSVPSSAMMPTLSAGDRILVMKSGLLVGPVTRGEIVVFRGPSYSPCNAGAVGDGDFVKRVIGLPGETIQSVGSTIDIDGRPLSEPGWYQSTSGPVGSTPIRRTMIPPGDYFVLGDSRTNSCDSRSFGAIPGSSIVGKVVAVFSHDGHPDFRVI
jgi:signal peptidase I